MRAPFPVALALVAALAILCGCGAERRVGAPRDVTLALDFAPNAVQAPVFTAAHEGLDRRRGIRLRIRQPGQGPDGVKLVAAGKAQLALLDIQDLPLARARGADVVGVAELVSRPLAALLAQPGIVRPRMLEHRTVGVSGLPSDPAFLKAVMRADGGDVRTVRQVTIGFSAVQRLLTRRVDAVPAFWNVEGVALRERGRPVKVFRVEDYGAPSYPEVVIITSRATLARRGSDIRAAIDAIAEGVDQTLRHPEAAVAQIAAVAGDEDRPLVGAQLRAVAPTWARDMRLHRAVLERWATWAAQVGIVGRRPDIGDAFVFGVGADGQRPKDGLHQHGSRADPGDVAGSKIFLGQRRPRRNRLVTLNVKTTPNTSPAPKMMAITPSPLATIPASTMIAAKMLIAPPGRSRRDHAMPRRRQDRPRCLLLRRWSWRSLDGLWMWLAAPVTGLTTTCVW